MPRHLVGFCLAAVFVAALPAHAPAQEIWAGAAKTWTTHDLLEDPAGLRVGVGVPVRGRLGLRLGYEWSGQNFESFGSTCVGLADPTADCDPETRRDRGRMKGVTVSLPFSAYERERIEAEVVPEGHLATVSSVQTGQRTDRSRSADQWMMGIGIGATLRVQVSRGGPVYLTLAGSSAWLSPVEEELIADGYTPFNSGFRKSTFEAGLSVTLR